MGDFVLSDWVIPDPSIRTRIQMAGWNDEDGKDFYSDRHEVVRINDPLRPANVWVRNSDGRDPVYRPGEVTGVIKVKLDE